MDAKITVLKPDDIRAFRKSRGWTQQAMADALGVSKRTVEVWESPACAAPAYLRLALAAIDAGIGFWMPPTID